MSDFELAVLLVDDDEMRELNRTWRGKDRTTDVLSFEQLEHDPERPSLEWDYTASAHLRSSAEGARALASRRG